MATYKLYGREITMIEQTSANDDIPEWPLVLAVHSCATISIRQNGEEININSATIPELVRELKRLGKVSESDE
jgi:DNA uptake protein ComE-like DNA-binding protein